MKRLNLISLILWFTLLLAGCGRKVEQESAPAPDEIPAVLPDTLQFKRGSKTYVITGIGISGTNTLAIINNQIVMPGAELNPGVVLESVHPTFASISIEGKTHLIRPESIQQEMNKQHD